MLDLAPPLPARRSELVIRPLGDHGPYVVKDPATGAYYHLGEEEHFLLTQLDGQRDAEAIRTAFLERFGQPLAGQELGEFLEMAKDQGFLEPFEDQVAVSGRPSKVAAEDKAGPLGLRLLYWRKNFFDPDRFFNWLAPKIWWCWTPGFLLFSGGCIGLAVGVLWANRVAVSGSFLSAMRWETAILAWLALMLVTACHEFAHGLTCKHYGGEVHEVGFLLIFFMPCFYCNVSDAWLFKEKSKRLWVTLAGGYFELFLWAAAVFVWRLTTPDSLLNYLAFVVLSASGVQTLFNFNPLLKLDGYYLLSDWLEAPNLQQRAGDYVKSILRWMLWGAARPEPDSQGRTLLVYGFVSWFYSLAFLGLSLVLMTHFFGAKLGVVGLVIVGFLGLLSIRGLFHGFAAGEVRNMILYRHKRVVIWAVLLVGVPVALFLIPKEDRASGPFRLRSAVRAELRAPVAGFVKEVCKDEGDRVSPGEMIVRIEVPDLASRLAQKSAEVREAQAKLRLLEVGHRYEELAEQRLRVERAQGYRDLGAKELDRARQVLEADLARLDKQSSQCTAELEFAQSSLDRARKLLAKASISTEEYREAEKKCQVFQAQGEQVQADKRARQARGCQEAEAELARRDKAWADDRAALTLMEAGTRPEELEAERARLARLREEAQYLETLKGKEYLCSRVAGVVATPHLKEMVNTYVREGESIAVVEEAAVLEAEIILPEQDMERVREGQRIELKARALPYQTFSAQVDRIAPVAERGEVQGSVTVYCRLEESSGKLRPGMTGHARIDTGRQSAGKVLVDRVLRYLRTEFWW
jgi:multidrug efflux pump subunit AcrA (membrane-fusion protein)